MITLRYYQDEAAGAAVKALKEYGNPFGIIIPTAGGKSVVVSEICHRINEPVLILQPSKEILEQNYNKLSSYGINDIAIYSASMKSKEIDKFTYATIGSIYKKPELFKMFKFVLVDEFHEINPKNLEGMYNSFFKAIGCKNVGGLSATPYRLVQKFYKKEDENGEMNGYYTAHLSTINRIPPFFFKKFAYKISIQELLEKGYLAPLEYKYYKDFDTSGLKINSTGADFDESALEKFWSDSRLEKLSKVILEIDGECKSNLIFCSSIRQAKKCTEMLNLMGLSAEYITSLDKPIERERKISWFRSGRIKHMCNVGVLTTGFDYPGLDNITLARPTISLALYYQMVGRGMRLDPTNPNKRCKIIDICELSKNMGRVETIKLAKEPGGFRDIVVSEVGEITGKPLFTFKLKNKEKKEKYLGVTV